MHINPLEYRVHMALLACISVAGLFSTVKVNNTITAWNDQRDANATHKAQITAIEKRADIAQAAIQLMNRSLSPRLLSMTTTKRCQTPTTGSLATSNTAHSHFSPITALRRSHNGRYAQQSKK